jgi:hypothetical protein
MVRFFNTISALALSSLLPSMVSGECKDPALGLPITQGSWSESGVNSTWIPARLDGNNINTQNPSWTIPEGTWTYPHGEVGPRGPNYRVLYTCSKLTFCNPEGVPDAEADASGRQLIDQFSEQDIWEIPSKEEFDACDFTNAVLIGTTSATSCVEIEKDDLTPEGEVFFYASKENCEAGQKIAAAISDYENTVAQCGAIATHIPGTDRIRTCDCDFQKKPFSERYHGLCALAYQESCYSVMQPGDCCEEGTCLSKLETFDNQMGKDHELARRETCDDNIPGLCYNMDAVATDMSGNGSTDCCSQTCSTCGSETASGAVFEVCTSNTPDNMTATCGRLSRYTLEDFVCDFSKCAEDSHWGSGGDAVWMYMDRQNPNPMESAAASLSTVLGVLSAGVVAALL